MVGQGYDEIHRLAQAFLGAQVAQQRHNVGEHQKGIAIRGIVATLASAF